MIIQLKIDKPLGDMAASILDIMTRPGRLASA
jgi:hypothetical protein